MPRRQTTQMELPIEGEQQMTTLDGYATLRPGFLVSLKTSVSGNVSYSKETIEPDHRVRSGAVKAKWQTERTIEDPEEHKKASQARMKARQIITSVCAKSAFGLLCPEQSVQKLELAVKEARRVADVFNKKSRVTHVAVYVISGRIARDDVEAVRAIKSEVRDLLKMMSDGVKNLDVKNVREAANKARNIGSMLSPEAAEKIKGAVEAARAAARRIVKAGDDAAQQIDQDALTAIKQARTAFLDIDDGDVIEAAPTAALTREVEFSEQEEFVVAGAVTGRLPAKTPAETQAPKKGKYTGKRKPATKKPVAKKKVARSRRATVEATT